MMIATWSILQVYMMSGFVVFSVILVNTTLSRSGHFAFHLFFIPDVYVIIFIAGKKANTRQIGRQSAPPQCREGAGYLLHLLFGEQLMLAGRATL